MKYLVTGTAGFIGFHVAKALTEQGNEVIGIDNFNDYYDVSLKEARNAILEKYPKYTIYRGDLADLKFVQHVFEKEKPQKVCHLAAQAGVRYSIINPHAYVQSNMVGFVNIMHTAKEHGVENFVYASSSSVYGKNKKTPFSVEDNVDHPISLYAASKKSNELMAHAYHHLYGMKMAGLRFFTVYGEWGRPDLSIFKFTKAMIEGRPIDVYNYGDMWRDFTYIADIVSGVLASLYKNYDYEIFNLGNNNTERLEDMISYIEDELGIKAKKNYMGMQPGDVYMTYADISASREKLGYEPKTKLRNGIKKFIEWYKIFYRVETPKNVTISKIKEQKKNLSVKK